jgi:hypothetical protein
MTRLMILCSLLMAIFAGDLGAQRQLSLEVNPIHATIGYGWTTAPDRIVGVELGMGVPQLDRTLLPADEPLIDFIHLGVFVRSQATPLVVLDGRAQLGLAELYGARASLPGTFTALSGGAFVGGRHVRVGPRLTAGMVMEWGNPAAFVVNLTPIALLFTYTW